MGLTSHQKHSSLIASVMFDDRIIFISTHQVRDLENMIDNVIIVDNGDLLLHASVASICNKLCFKTVTEIPVDAKILYEEKALKGTAVVMENIYAEDSKLNLEQLFTGVTENPAIAKQIFSSN